MIWPAKPKPRPGVIIACGEKLQALFARARRKEIKIEMMARSKLGNAVWELTVREITLNETTN